MTTIKSYTDIKQSRKLAEILPIESADMYYDRYGTPSFIDKYVTHESIKSNKYQDLIPCWSLAALLDVLPRKVELEDTAYTIGVSLDSINYSNVNNGNLLLEVKVKDNLVDACYEVIIKLYELKML